jgi:TRAP-type C4-dicarboxylate transport system permease large subunit
MSFSTEVSKNSLDVWVTRRDALLMASSVVVLIFLWIAAGWGVALEVAVAAAFGAVFVDEVQRRDIRVLGR